MKLQNSSTKVLIVGGGIAGLSCASRLAARGVPFRLVTNGIGGRVTSDEDGLIQYGAYYLLACYRNLLPLCSNLRRIYPWELGARTGQKEYGLCSLRAVRLAAEASKYFLTLATFYRHYKNFQSKCHLACQSEVLAQDPYLSDLYHRSAGWLLDKLGVSRWAEDFAGPVAQASTFVTLDQLSAFDILQNTLHFIVPCYRFDLDTAAFVRPFRAAIAIDEVGSVARDGGRFQVDTTSGARYFGDVLVMAAGHRSFELIPSHEPIGGLHVETHMTHVRGDVRPEWSRFSHYCFPLGDTALALARQADSTYLVYTQTRADDEALNRFFFQPNVIARRPWNPAFRLGLRRLVSCHPEPGVIRAGDFNVVGLEDSYITGHYAANAAESALATSADIPEVAHASSSR